MRQQEECTAAPGTVHRFFAHRRDCMYFFFCFAVPHAYKHPEERAAVMHSHNVTRWLYFQGQISIVRFIF